MKRAKIQTKTTKKKFNRLQNRQNALVAIRFVTFFIHCLPYTYLIIRNIKSRSIFCLLFSRFSKRLVWCVCIVSCISLFIFYFCFFSRVFIFLRFARTFFYSYVFCFFLQLLVLFIRVEWFVLPHSYVFMLLDNCDYCCAVF